MRQRLTLSIEGLFLYPLHKKAKYLGERSLEKNLHLPILRPILRENPVFSRFFTQFYLY
jgi:hypothetical protein